jgi:hypothetical protein
MTGAFRALGSFRWGLVRSGKGSILPVALAPRSQLRRLCVRRDRGGQGELKGRARPGIVDSPQVAAMRLND